MPNKGYRHTVNKVDGPVLLETKLSANAQIQGSHCRNTFTVCWANDRKEPTLQPGI